MHTTIHELSRQTIDDAVAQSDVLARIQEASPNGFEDVVQRVGRVGVFGSGIEAAVTFPLGTADGQEAESAIIHPLGLGNGIMGPRNKGGHQLLLAEIMATACETPVITIGSPTPNSNYRLSPLELQRFIRGTARPYAERIAGVITDPKLRMRLGSVTIASSTQPGGAVAPDLAIRIQDQSEGTIAVSNVLIGDPATVTRRSVRGVVADSTQTGLQAYAAPLGESLLHHLYTESLFSETAAPPYAVDAWQVAAERVHKRNIGTHPLHRTIAMTGAIAAYMRHPSLFGDVLAAHRANPETRFTVGFTESPVTPESDLLDGFEQAAIDTPSLTDRLSIVALRGVGRGVWDNPVIWPVVQAAA